MTSDAYLPAGMLGVGVSAYAVSSNNVLGGTLSVTALPAAPSAVVLTANTANGLSLIVDIPAQPAITPLRQTTQNVDGPPTFGMSAAQTSVIAGSIDFGDTVTDGGEVVTHAVELAQVFAGPFMEVKLQSSSTKMVIGAACVEGVDASETNYFLNNASKVVTASDATVFIEGGFGKLTLQTGDYAGGVAAIGDAGDAADLDVDGLALIIEGAGLIGMNPYIAVDLEAATLAAPSNLANLDILTGGTLNLGGLTAAVDVMLNAEDVLDITAWDLGLDYAMGDMAVSAAYDSTNAWGLSASMDVAGFGVDATIYNKAQEDHVKTGLYYSVAASTSLNGFGLSIGLDQDMQPTVDLTKDLGGLSLYAGYDAADEGGKIGATLSF